MANKPKKSDEHMFSIELNSKKHVKSISFANDDRNNVLIEGFLGKLTGVSFTEGIMLSIKGSNGILRMDLTEEEMENLLPKKTVLHRKEEARI